ncbi:unnamed protein product [Cylicocyclus nassatus]|uniref:Uncharacterized protein n=1 Tax=Cylicocyclus nassatus TaxID=53992 RepID=A0AA36GMD0_CYLNA|nr:unnamed protein product [Cylicocyclus nassatus]
MRSSAFSLLNSTSHGSTHVPELQRRTTALFSIVTSRNSEFSNRIRRAVQKLLKGAPKEMVQDRLLEEFVERLQPESKFHIKSLDPATFDEALRKVCIDTSRRNTWMNQGRTTVKKEGSHHPTTTGLER